MSILFLILPVTLLLSAGAAAAFAWATRSGQFDDLETPAIRLLHEDRAAKDGRGGISSKISDSPD